MKQFLHGVNTVSPRHLKILLIILVVVVFLFVPVILPIGIVNGMPLGNNMFRIGDATSLFSPPLGFKYILIPG